MSNIFGFHKYIGWKIATIACTNYTSNIQSQGFHQVCNIHLQSWPLFHVQVDAMQ
jgi:hypothetical protein